jgi:orotate phosphoribosyltransferase
LIEAKRQGKYALACYDRGEAKSHGTGKVLEGVVPSNESFVIIPDDVFTTGKSVVQTVISLVNSGISTLPKGILVVANRSEPYQNSLQLPENYIEIIESMKGKLVDEIYTKIQETVNEMRSIGSESFVEITILELFKDADFKKE